LTNEERERLCADLRRMWPTKTASDAADELERLADQVISAREIIFSANETIMKLTKELQALAQSDAEPSGMTGKRAPSLC
jgi:hypothetical protein